MEIDWQFLIAISIVVFAATVLVRGVYKRLTGAAGGCHTGGSCQSCPSNKTTDDGFVSLQPTLKRDQ